MHSRRRCRARCPVESAESRRAALSLDLRIPGLDVLKLASLPPADTKRWVTRRKAEVVAAVRNGLISLEEACQRYHLSIEEFLSWQSQIERHGLPGLRVTRTQDYRAAALNK